MIRNIIDVPLPMMRVTQLLWDIDWGTQSTGQDTGGGDQIVFNRFPRFVGQMALRFDRDGIGQWRALRARVQGRRHALRIRMVDPATMQAVGVPLDGGWQAWLSGVYEEPRPTIRCRTAVAAGATQIEVDETAAAAPVAVGSHLSFKDWPFLVTGRSGSGATTVLQVELLRTAIALDDQIDLIPRGLFVPVDPALGGASYDYRLRSAPEWQLSEWLTRPPEEP